MKNQMRKLLISISVLALALGYVQVPPVYAVQYQFNDASLELTDTNPGSVANWIIDFKTVQEIPVSGKVVITPQATKFTIAADTDYTDLDLKLGGVETTLAETAGSGAGTAWGVAVTVGASGSITLTNNDADVVVAGTVINIEIGTNATQGTTGDKQITNPSKTAGVGTADIWSVDVTSTTAAVATIDTIDLLIAIIEDIDIYGSQKPQMTMTMTGETAPDGGAIAANYIEWKEVAPGTPKTGVLRVKVNTDAKDGFTVYVKQDHNMQHSEDAAIDIDGITGGSNGTPAAWATPNGTTIAVNTGYLGYHTSDATLGTGTADRFTDADTWAALSTTASEVLYHATASQSDVDGQDRADITFKLETNNLQPSGNYQNEITFIAKPIF